MIEIYILLVSKITWGKRKHGGLIPLVGPTLPFKFLQLYFLKW
jgi:hypothetical protein